MSSNRQSLRSELRLKRQQLSIVQQNDAASALLSILVTNIHLKAHEKIALYLSNDGEISPAELCKWCWTQNIEVYLPVINDKALVFARYGRSSNWKKNRFGILEPIDSTPISGSELDWVFMPLVGFDHKGDRLGMGGGFYDRTFEHKSDKTKLIGLAHDCQEVNQLPTASWDVPLSGIITPTRYINCQN